MHWRVLLNARLDFEGKASVKDNGWQQRDEEKVFLWVGWCRPVSNDQTTMCRTLKLIQWANLVELEKNLTPQPTATPSSSANPASLSHATRRRLSQCPTTNATARSNSCGCAWMCNS